MTETNPHHAVQQWIKTVVVGLNLCPFAKRVIVKDGIRFFVSEADSEDHLLADLQDELNVIESDKSIETTVLIHPHVLGDFEAYNQFLGYADALLEATSLEGVFQIASFHPDYQFSGTEPGDAENYSNRSPYPMLHILREDSVFEAIDTYPDAENIPTRNIQLLKETGKEKLQAMLEACFENPAS
ncbi:MAG: DUF1415 domain-containing protein [Rhodothermales bacterium]